MQNQITTNSESEPVAAPASPAWKRTMQSDVHIMNNRRKNKNQLIRGVSALAYIKAKSHIDPATGCWNWVNSYCRGYGTAWHSELGGRTIFAHRASWIVHYGPIEKGKLICHKCDNPKCVNPEHLFLGTAKDNSDDCSSKGRKPRGTKIKGSILVDDDIPTIRHLLNQGLTCKFIGSLYGVSRSTIASIKAGQTWKFSCASPLPPARKEPVNIQ